MKPSGVSIERLTPAALTAIADSVRRIIATLRDCHPDDTELRHGFSRMEMKLRGEAAARRDDYASDGEPERLGL